MTGNFLIEIPFDPNIRLGPLTLAWHGIFAALGGLAGYWLARRLAPRAGIREADVDQIAMWAIVSGLVGARVVYAIDNWASFADRPLHLLMIWTGGMAIWGGILGGIVGGVAVARANGLRVPALADLGGIGLILGQGIGRIGDIINGEHNALASNLPWAFLYTNPNTMATRDSAGSTFPEHPAVGYEMLFDFAILGVLLLLLRRWGGTGRVFWVYAFLYSLGRFLVSFLRVDPAQGPLQLAQWLGLAGMALAIVMLARLFTARSAAPAAATDLRYSS